MRPCASVAGTRCTRCTPRLELQLREHVLALDQRDDFLHAARRALVHRHHLDLPALALGVARVHAVEVAGEQRGLVAAGAAADLEDRVLAVVRILRQQQDLDLLLGSAALASSSCASSSRAIVAQLGVGLGVGHLLGLREIPSELLVALPRRDQRLELRVLARELHELGALADDLGGAEQRSDFFVATLERSPSCL